MAECPSLASRPFFNDSLTDMPAMANVYKKKYCKDDFANCARYMVSKKLGKGKVPSTLFPYRIEKPMN
jgi:hypothetical protein